MIFPAGQLDKNEPMIAARMRDIARGKRGFTVIALYYPKAGESDGAASLWTHRAPKAALRRAGSVIAGKLSRGTEHAVSIVTPCGSVLSFYELQTAITSD